MILAYNSLLSSLNGLCAGKLMFSNTIFTIYRSLAVTKMEPIKFGYYGVAIWAKKTIVNTLQRRIENKIQNEKDTQHM